jgi:hypothetical protein
MPKGSRRKKTRKQMDVPAHVVNKSTPKTAEESTLDAKTYVKENKQRLYKIQKTKGGLKTKQQKLYRRKVHESDKEKKLVSKLSKKIRNKTKLREKSTQKKGEMQDPWAMEEEVEKRKPALKEYQKVRNPAVMVPVSGESHNPSQGAYSNLVDKMFDKGS